MNKYMELIKNFSVLTISNFGSKVLVFFLVPLYTFVLSTEQYGNYDLISVTIELLIPIFTINISDAVVRFLLDKENVSKDVISIAFKHTIFSIILAVFFTIVNSWLNIFTIFNTYGVYFVLLFSVNSLYQVMQSITKGEDKLKELAVSGIINSILVIVLNLFFLLLLKLELIGYFYANILAIFISTIYLAIRLNVIKNIKLIKINKNLQKRMIIYSTPMIFNSIGWWINNVSDRYVVTLICGVAANGVYSVAYKIPSILSMIQSIFNQAWTVSAIKSENDADKEQFYKNVYHVCNIVIIISCSGLIILSKEIANFLYLKDFFEAWIYTPFLLISVVFGTLSGVLGSIFAACNATKEIGKSTFLGAIINTILNIILVIIIGPIGAALSTMISFFIVWLIRIKKIKKYINLDVDNIKNYFIYFILLIQAIIIVNIKNFYIFEIILFILLIYLLKEDLKKNIKQLLYVFKKK